MQQAAAPIAPIPGVAYEDDFVLWADHQAQLLREGRLGELDVVHLIEEVEGVGNSHRDGIESRLTVLLAHLLKWKYQPGHRWGSWQGTIVEQRRRIVRGVRRAPNLRGYPHEVFIDCYLSGHLDAARETGIDFYAPAQGLPLHARSSARPDLPSETARPPRPDPMRFRS